MPEITWRNVNSLANSTGVQNAIGNLQHSLTALGNVGTKYIDKRLANEEEYRKNLKQTNTEAIINQMQQVQDFQQLAQAKATGVYDLGALQHLSGGLIDGKQFNNAYSSWDKDTLGKVQTADTALDYNPETKAALGQYYQAISQGDTARAAELFKNINASRGTTYTLAKDQYNILKDERDYNSKSLKETLDLHDKWIKANQDVETSAEQLKQFELKADARYQVALLNNPNLTKEQFLASLPEYQELLKKHTAYKAISDSINQTYLSHKQGRALGNTSGSPYSSQSERQSERVLNNTNNTNNTNALYKFAVDEFSKHGLPKHVVNAYIGSESNFQTDSKNPNSTATGLGQIITSTWNESAKKLGLPLVTKENQGTNQDPRLNPKMNLKMSAYQASEAYKRTKDNANSAGYTDEGLIVKVGIFAGSTGANKIWKALKDNPNTPIEKLLSAKAIEANPFLKGKTAKTAIDYFENLVNKQYDGSTNSTNIQTANTQTAKDIVNEATKPNTSVATEVIDNAVKAGQATNTKDDFNEKNFIDVDGSLNIKDLKEAVKNKTNELEQRDSQILGAISSNPFSSQSIKTDRVFNQILDDLVSNKSVDEWSEVTKEFVKGFPALDPSNPNSASTQRAVIEALKEYANSNDAVKIEEGQELLQRTIGADKAGAFNIDDFNVPKTIQVPSKNGALTETEQSLKNRFFDKSGKLKSISEVNKQIDALFAQTGLYDQITVRDNIRKAIQATGNPMLILKAYQNAMLQTYRYEKGKPSATLEEVISSNYVPDLDFNSFDGTDFGKQFLQKIDAMAGFNKSTLDTLNNQSKLINERHANRGSGAAKIDYIRKSFQTADANNVVNFGNPRKYWEDNGVINRHNYNEAEKKAHNEVGKHAIEIMNSLPKNAQSFINKINKYGNLDSSEVAFIQKSVKDTPVTLTPEQYRNIINITRENANHPEVQKLIAFMESYGSNIKISDKK